MSWTGASDYRDIKYAESLVGSCYENLQVKEQGDGVQGNSL